jgi:biopolymer transport protein ExbB
MLALIKDGGFIMWPLIIFSVVAWSVFFEKLVYHANFKKKSALLHASLIQALKQGADQQVLKGILQGHPELMALPFLAILEGLPDDLKLQKLQRELKKNHSALRSHLWILGTISSSAPFIGLFGTVVGIISSFDSIAKAGKSGFAVVASGLSEALIATAAGIIVAVVAVIFYNFFINRVKSINESFHYLVQDFEEQLRIQSKSSKA